MTPTDGNPAPPIRRGFYLTPGEIHLWLLYLDQVVDPGLPDRYHELLDSAEQAHFRRLRLPKVARQYLLSRVLVRSSLSFYSAVPPSAWRFRPGSHGRPVITDPGLPGLDFNLAHTEGLIVCAVSRDTMLGVDVEYLDRDNQLIEIAERFFAPAEYRDLRALPVARQRERFFDYWTLKEAYIKARGLGLACPLGKFAFHLRPGERIGLDIDPELGDNSERWHSRLGRPTLRHRLALCSTSATTPRIWRCVPLVAKTVEPLSLDDRLPAE